MDDCGDDLSGSVILDCRPPIDPVIMISEIADVLVQDPDVLADDTRLPFMTVIETGNVAGDSSGTMEDLSNDNQAEDAEPHPEQLSACAVADEVIDQPLVLQVESVSEESVPLAYTPTSGVPAFISSGSPTQHLNALADDTPLLSMAVMETDITLGDSSSIMEDAHHGKCAEDTKLFLEQPAVCSVAEDAIDQPLTLQVELVSEESVLLDCLPTSPRSPSNVTLSPSNDPASEPKSELEHADDVQELGAEVESPEPSTKQPEIERVSQASPDGSVLRESASDGHDVQWQDAESKEIIPLSAESMLHVLQKYLVAQDDREFQASTVVLALASFIAFGPVEAAEALSANQIAELISQFEAVLPSAEYWDKETNTCWEKLLELKYEALYRDESGGKLAVS